MRIGLTLALQLLMLAAIGCGGSGPSACQQRCPDYAITVAERCDALCTSSCEDLAADYGLSQERCESLQRGD